MAEPTAEARIRDLERRLDMDPGSRLFVSLAEEYRKLGRVRDALSALQKGLLAHPGYVAAQVAMGRCYLEANQTTDAIATFTKVLVADPGNLVASKSLADIYLSRGDNLEAIKKYKLYRALSGDRKVDAVIAHLETVVAPRPVTPSKVVARVESPPPPPSFQDTDKGRRAPPPRVPAADLGPLTDPFDITSVAFEIGEDSGKAKVIEGPFLVPTRDLPLGSEPSAAFASSPAPSENASPAPDDVKTGVIRIADVFPEEPAVSVPAAAPPAPPEPAAPAAPEIEKPTGRALADLYYAQGHYADALQIYDDLVTRHPFDAELHRMRRDAEAQLLPAASTPEGSAADPGLGRRLARIRALKQWLSRVQEG